MPTSVSLSADAGDLVCFSSCKAVRHDDFNTWCVIISSLVVHIFCFVLMTEPGRISCTSCCEDLSVFWFFLSLSEDYNIPPHPSHIFFHLHSLDVALFGRRGQSPPPHPSLLSSAETMWISLCLLLPLSLLIAVAFPFITQKCEAFKRCRFSQVHTLR